MRIGKRILIGVAIAALGAVYTWIAAVRAAPGVAARKEDARRARRTTPSPPSD